MRKPSKKGQSGGAFNQIASLGIGVATLIIVFAVVFLILAETRTQILAQQTEINITNTSSYTAAYNGTLTLTDAAADVPDWVPLIVIATIGAILLGLVSLFRARR